MPPQFDLIRFQNTLSISLVKIVLFYSQESKTPFLNEGDD